jgi:hypothetical protein
MSKEQVAAAGSFDLSSFDAVDEAEMEVYANGQPTGWKFRIAGPGHPKTIEQSNKLAKERLRREKEQEQARINGKRWKAPDESVDEVLERNVNLVVDRLLGWSPVTMDGKDYPFSVENARALLLDRRKGQLLIQALEFLGDEQSFGKRSASN